MCVCVCEGATVRREATDDLKGRQLDRREATDDLKGRQLDRSYRRSGGATVRRYR